MRFGPAYYDARQMQAVLVKTVCEGKTSARDIAQCVGAWINLEKLKREMRGIPPLAAAKLKELKELFDREKRARRASLDVPTELHPTETYEPSARPEQSPSHAATSTMRDMPSLPGAKVMVVKKPPAPLRAAPHINSLKGRAMEAERAGEIS